MILFSTGTELYRERLVRALARDSKVPLLILDSSVLAPYVSFPDVYFAMALEPFMNVLA